MTWPNCVVAVAAAAAFSELPVLWRHGRSEMWFIGHLKGNWRPSNQRSARRKKQKQNRKYASWMFPGGCMETSVFNALTTRGGVEARGRLEAVTSHGARWRDILRVHACVWVSEQALIKWSRIHAHCHADVDGPHVKHTHTPRCLCAPLGSLGTTVTHTNTLICIVRVTEWQFTSVWLLLLLFRFVINSSRFIACAFVFSDQCLNAQHHLSA